MTKREAAIVSAYTGFLCGTFSELHKYAEEVLGHPIWTHVFADKAVVTKLKEAAKVDFVKLSEGLNE